MIHPEYFGNPYNPFDEEDEHPEYLLWDSPIRSVASSQILYMIGFQDRVLQTTDSSGLTTRVVQLDATAPLHEEGVFLNDEETDFDQSTGRVEWRPIFLSLEDVVTSSNDITERRIVVTRPSNVPFGVAGLNARGKTISNLSSLTLKLTSEPEPHAEIWGNMAGVSRLLMKATSPFTEQLDFHLIALGRTLLRQLDKIAYPEKGEPKYNFSDFK